MVSVMYVTLAMVRRSTSYGILILHLLIFNLTHTTFPKPPCCRFPILVTLNNLILAQQLELQISF